MPTTTLSCPHSQTDVHSCPALRPDGACIAPTEMADLVRAAVARAATAEGLDASSLDVSLSCASPGALRLALRGDGLDTEHAGQRLGVRALAGLCPGARAAETISVCVTAGA